MTIKELETRTGMARANIRFYEGEGLLSPKRLANGYRDYSEEDARTLEKIKLLRQLQLDIDTIRKVQQGTLTLEQALFTQLTRLEGDKAIIERAAEVCRDLERSGVEYAALEPEPWLRALEAPPAPRPEPLPPPVIQPERDDAPRACYHPWQRYFARALDMLLYSTVFEVLWLVLLRDQGIVLIHGMAGGLVDILLEWLLALIGLAFALAVEPLWLHFWGWTPGKWVFGLKLRNVNGEKLSLNRGLQRSYTLIWEGYGLSIPFYSLWRFWKCRELGLGGMDCCWDSYEGYRYTKEERRVHPAVIYVPVMVVCVAALAAGIRYTQTPPNQGGLTVEEFAKNYNYYFRQLAGDSGLPTLGSDGRWVEQKNSGMVIFVFGETTEWDDPEFTLTDGRVTAVKLHMESGDMAVSISIQEELALLAMTGALDNLNLFNYDMAGWVKAYGEHTAAWQDADFTCRGLRITQQAEYTGYEYSSVSGSGYLYCFDEDAPHHCEKTVTISLIE